LNRGHSAHFMRSLLELEAFAPIADNLRAVSVELVSSDAVTFLIPPSPTGAVASAFLEAAMLDAGIPYRRRFAPRQVSSPYIEIAEGKASDKPAECSLNPISLSLTPFFSVGLRGHDGSPHRGILSTVAQAAALAELIAPDGKRTRRLRPWLLAGNWWGDALDQGYDPVYSSLRDHLRDEGSVRIVPLPEVESPDLSRLKQLDREREASTRESWPSLDSEGKAQALSTLVMPQVLSDKTATSRLEELVWHRIIVSNSVIDLHTKMTTIRSQWDGSHSTSSEMIDSLLANTL